MNRNVIFYKDIKGLYLVISLISFVPKNPENLHKIHFFTFSGRFWHPVWPQIWFKFNQNGIFSIRIKPRSSRIIWQEFIVGYLPDSITARNFHESVFFYTFWEFSPQPWPQTLPTAPEIGIFHDWVMQISSAICEKRFPLYSFLYFKECWNLTEKQTWSLRNW